MKKALLICTILFFTCACSPLNANNAGQKSSLEANQVAYGLLGPGPINYGKIRDDKNEYQYDGMINQSPSFRTLDRHRPDIGDDQDKVRTIVRQEGADPKAVFIEGKDIWVYVTISSQDQKEKKEKQAYLQKVLAQAMQRYDVHLRLSR